MDTWVGVVIYVFMASTAYGSIHRLHFLPEMHEKDAIAFSTYYKNHAEDQFSHFHIVFILERASLCIIISIK